jgi:hypothetical protein
VLPTEENLSAAEDVVPTDSLLSLRVRVPQGVVYRSFVKETVILNLDTGLYHGVNPTGGRMLDVLASTDSVGEAAKILANDYGRPLAEIESDLCEFCQALIERGLIAAEPA